MFLNFDLNVPFLRNRPSFNCLLMIGHSVINTLLFVFYKSIFISFIIVHFVAKGKISDLF